MIRRRWTSCLLALAGISASWPVNAAAQQPPQLIPFPSNVKPGGVLYLAGGGFPAGQSLTVTLVCLNWYESLYGRWNYTLSASKIADGTFSGWKIRAGFPLIRDTVTCTLTAPFGDNPFAVTAPLTISSADTTLKLARVPISDVRTRPASRTSNYQSFRAATAPGAHLHLTIHYPHLPSMSVKVKADWTGQAALRWRLPSSVKRGTRAKVMVSGRLGVFSGAQAVRMLARR